MSINEQIQRVRSEFKKDLSSLSDGNINIEEIKIKFLARKGLVANLFMEMGNLDIDNRPKMGQLLNQLKLELTQDSKVRRI